MRPIIEIEGTKARLWLSRPQIEQSGLASVPLSRDDVEALHRDLGSVLYAMDTEAALDKAVSDS